VADITETKRLLHGEESYVFADAGYTGVAKRDELKKMAEGPRKDLATKVEKIKAQIRAKIEHPVHVVKNLFRYRKIRYRGLLKNTAHLFTLFALGNLVLARRVNPSQSA
tara:strand:- start:361 stop:687 length:327 start_codon:yes stop_codon:yes gene_type:complete